MLLTHCEEKNQNSCIKKKNKKNHTPYVCLVGKKINVTLVSEQTVYILNGGVNIKIRDDSLMLTDGARSSFVYSLTNTFTLILVILSEHSHWKNEKFIK